MALRDKIRTNVQPLLEPDEEIQVVIGAQTTSPWAVAFISAYMVIFQNGYRVVAATDRRVLVLQAGRVRLTTIKGIESEHPRQTQIGPWHGTVWYKTDNLGRTLHIHRRFKKDVEAADAAVAGGGMQATITEQPPTASAGESAAGAEEAAAPPPGQSTV